MKPPNYQNCTEAELWRYVGWHLEGAGIRSVLVGGAVVSIYTEGLYQSGDLDLIPDHYDRTHLPAALAQIGFLPGKSRYFKHPDCVKDRLAAYIHWKVRSRFNQAVLVCRRQKERINLDQVRKWCIKEGSASTYDELIESLSKPENSA